MKDYIIYIEKVKTSVITVPAKNKKEALKKAERFIDDIEEEKIDINKIIRFNPEYEIKARPRSTNKSAFFNGRKRK